MTARKAIRILIDSGRCIYSYLGGSYIQLPPKEGVGVGLYERLSTVIVQRLHAAPAVAGLSGGSGKTIVTLGLLLFFAVRASTVRAFKKGPDYIDPAWLAWASGHPARNLDTFLMGAEAVRVPRFVATVSPTESI